LFQLVIVALLPAFGLIIYHSGEQRNRAVRDAQYETLRLARLVASNQRRLIDSSGHLLIALSQLPVVRDGERTACSELFARLLKEYRPYANLGVANLNGDVICSARPLPAAASIADRSYFRDAVKRKELAVGNYQIGGISEKASLSLGYPVFDTDRRLSAVVFLALDLASISQTAKIAGLPLGSVVTLYDREGTILSTYPESEELIGKSFRGAEIVELALAQGEGVAEVTGIDGKKRLYGFSSIGPALQKRQIFLHIGIPKEIALADADWFVKRNLAALLIAGALALLAAWYLGDVLLVRQLKTLAKTTARIGAGDFSARTGLGRRKNEIDRFAASLDTMATLLERRHKEAQSAKNRVQRQLARSDALREIDMAISSTLDLRGVLHLLLEKSDLVLRGGVATIRLFNKQTGELEAVACRNLDEAAWRAEDSRIMYGFEKTVLENRIPLTIANVQTDARAAGHQFAAKFGLVSCLGVPLIAAGELVGLIAFYTREEHAFDDEEIDFLTALAGLSAVASYNGRLFEEIRQREREALALHALTAAASQSLDINVILKEAVAKISDNFHFDATRIFLFSHDMTELKIKAACDSQPQSWTDIQRWQPGESILGRVAVSGEPMIFEDLKADSNYRRLSASRVAEIAGNRFLAMFPIKTKLKNWGAAVFAGVDPRKLTDQEIRLLTSMTQQIGIAVENANLYEQTAAKAKELTALYSFAGLASQSLDINVLLRKTAEKILDIFQFDAARVYLRRADSDDIELVTHMGFATGVTLVPRYRVSDGRVGHAVESGEPMFVEDMESDDAYQRTAHGKLMLKQGFRSSFLIPIKVGGESLGVMNFLRKQPYRFSQSDVQLMTALAYHLGVAVGNANLYSQVRRKTVELEHANKAKDEFLGVVSHELRTPLNVIKGYAEVLRGKMFGELNDQQESALDKIKSQSMDLLYRINEVLRVTTIEAKTIKLARADIDLGALFNELRESYRFAGGITRDLVFDFPSDLPTIRTDDEKIKAILQNLINNAIKFTEQGIITVSARGVPKQKAVELRVSDTGIGIPSDKIETIFGMFQQVDSSVTRGYGGVGLGLYIVKNYTELMGGRIEVESELGKGTVFTVTLPVDGESELLTVGPTTAQKQNLAAARPFIATLESR
jgi:signal transduction histidine kinase